MRLKALIIVAIIAALVLGLGLGFGPSSKKAIDTSDTTPFLSEWMDYIRDDVLVKNTVIPGSHDAGTYGMMWAAETQNRTIKEQLESGSRYFDIRVEKKGDKHVIFHTIIKGAEFEPMLNDISAFLTAHPSEFLILDFQKFKGGSQADVIALLSAQLGDKVVKNNTSNSDLEFIDALTVGEARGKCIIIWGDRGTVGNADYLFLRGDDKGTSADATLRSFYERKYNASSSSSYIKKGLPAYLTRRQNYPTGLFVLQGQLTDPVVIIGPKAIEAKHDKNMSNYLKNFDCSAHQLNIVMRDYVGPRKCAEIIALNLAYNNVPSARVTSFTQNVRNF